jgi:hypothetical protein
VTARESLNDLAASWALRRRQEALHGYLGRRSLGCRHPSCLATTSASAIVVLLCLVEKLTENILGGGSLVLTLMAKEVSERELTTHGEG